jgi:hypothetical protein
VLFVSSTDYFLHVGYISHLSLYVDQLFGISLVQIAGIPLSNDHDDPCRADALIPCVQMRYEDKNHIVDWEAQLSVTTNMGKSSCVTAQLNW